MKQFLAKTTVHSPLNNLHYPPNFQLTYDQLQCLTSNDLFIQFCNQIDPNQINSHIGIRQFLNKLSTYTDTQQIKQWFFSSKRTCRKQIK